MDSSQAGDGVAQAHKVRAGQSTNAKLAFAGYFIAGGVPANQDHCYLLASTTEGNRAGRSGVMHAVSAGPRRVSQASGGMAAGPPLYYGRRRSQ